MLNITLLNINILWLRLEFKFSLSDVSYNFQMMKVLYAELLEKGRYVSLVLSLRRCKVIRLSTRETR